MSRWFTKQGAFVNSLKFRLTVVSVLALALGILMITALVEQQAEDDLIRAQQHRELEAVVQTAAVLSRRVLEYQQIMAAASEVLDERALSSDAALHAALQGQPLMLRSFSGLFLARLDGSVRMVVDERGGHRTDINISDRPYFQRTLTERRALVSAPLTTKTGGKPALIFTQPLVRAGRVVGILGGGVRLDSRHLFDDLVEGTDDTDQSIVVVTDGNGQVLAHPDSSRLMTQLADDEPRFGQAVLDWKSLGSPSEPSGLHLHQEAQLVTVAGVAGQDWVVWQGLPEDDLLAPLRSARMRALKWAALIIVGLAGLMLLLLSRLLRPLVTLRHRAQHLFDGQDQQHADWPDDKTEIGHLARVLRHVGAERAQFEAFNDQVLKKLGSVMHAAPVGIAFTRSHRFELVSDEFCRLLGRNDQELLGQHVQKVYARPEHYAELSAQIILAFKSGQPYLGEWEMVRTDGSVFWAELRGRPVDVGDIEAGAIWTVSDISEKVAERSHLTWSATHDVLTGLANRRCFTEHLNRLFESLPLALPAELIVIDLDHFKPINDLAGHAAGDAMLKAVAAAIGAKVRGTDLVVRTGGDEFAVLLAHCSHEVAMRIAEGIRTAITDIAIEWEGHLLRVGASLGVASLSSRTPDAQAWLHAADAACYAAKAQGRDAVLSAERPRLRVVGQH